MNSNAEYLLSTLLQCGTADLSLLEDVDYDLDEIAKECQEEFGCLELNAMMEIVFSRGLEELDTAVKDRIAQLEAIENEQELDEDEKKELDCIRELHPLEDAEQYHNFLDTSIWWRDDDKVGYCLYFQDALDNFYKMTGFEIG